MSTATVSEDRADGGFERRRDVSVPERLGMSADKTAALLSCAASIGAVLIGASDLRSRNKSAPVVAALCAGTAASERLAELYLRPGLLSGPDLSTAATLVEEAGGRQWAEREAFRRLARSSR